MVVVKSARKGGASGGFRLWCSQGPYEMTEIHLEDTYSDDENPRQPCQIVRETYANTSPENRKLIDDEAEAIHMITNGISNEIYSTMDACPNAKEIRIAIERLQEKRVY
ncbi:hypothetical protein Tco_1052187 [Tanacetum coccineum]